MSEDKMKADVIEQKLKADLELLSGSFQSYKLNLDLEYKQIIENKENEFIEKYETITREKIEDAINSLNNERAKEKKESLRQQRAELEIIKKKSQDDLNVTFIFEYSINFI